MRVLRDVIVNRVGPDELLAISHAPAIAGEDMSLGLVGGGTSLELRVRVLESRPVIIDGAVRHRVRLAVARPERRVDVSPSALLDLSAGAGAEAV
jgi:hypothetical protein